MPDFYFIEGDGRMMERLAAATLDLDSPRSGVDSDQVVLRLMVRRTGHCRGRGHTKYRNKAVFSLDPRQRITMVMPMKNQLCTVLRQNTGESLRVIQAAPESCPSS